MKFEIIDHTGDVGVIVYGSGFNEILKNSVFALSDLVFPDTGFQADITETVRVEGATNEELLLNLLSLVVQRIDSDGLIFYDINNISEGVGSINAELKGMKIREGMNYEYVLKAVTYHDLEVNTSKGYARIIFDI
ncbi:MAG: archease [Thermoplasmataceae archaeon]